MLFRITSLYFKDFFAKGNKKHRHNPDEAEDELHQKGLLFAKGLRLIALKLYLRDNKRKLDPKPKGAIREP